MPGKPFLLLRRPHHYPAIPKHRQFRETIPIEYMADVLAGRPGFEKLDESTLEPVKVPYVFEGEKYETESGKLTTLTYAMEGSVIDVADGSKLDIFMANNNVLIRLMGDNALLRIQKTTKNCQRIQITGRFGEAVIGGGNVELGEGIDRKLAT